MNRINWKQVHVTWQPRIWGIFRLTFRDLNAWQKSLYRGAEKSYQSRLYWCWSYKLHLDTSDRRLQRQQQLQRREEAAAAATAPWASWKGTREEHSHALTGHTRFTLLICRWVACTLAACENRDARSGLDCSPPVTRTQQRALAEERQGRRGIWAARGRSLTCRLEPSYLHLLPEPFTQDYSYKSANILTINHKNNNSMKLKNKYLRAITRLPLTLD